MKKEISEPGQKIDVVVNYLKLVVAMLEELGSDLKEVLEKE